VGTYQNKGNGLWRFQVQRSGVRYTSPYQYETQREAQRAEKKYLKRKESNSLVQCIELRKKYLRTRTTSPDYYNENLRYFKKMEEAFGEDTPVNEITKEMVNDLLESESIRLENAGKTNHKVNALLRVMKAFFNYCIDYLDIEMKNPAKGIKPFPVQVNMKYIPTDVDVGNVRRYLNPAQKKLFDFVAETGCRINEAVGIANDKRVPGLLVEDVEDDYVVLRSRKSKNSNTTPRTVPRPKCLKDEDLPEEGKVFKDWNGYPHFLDDIMRHNSAMLGSKSWNWHNLRHRAASKWAAEGMTMIEIMNRLGHVNIQTTQKYLQLLGFTRF
jgi:integrase